MRYKHTPIVVEKPENCVAVPIIDTKCTEGDNEKDEPAKKKSSLMALQSSAGNKFSYSLTLDFGLIVKLSILNSI